MKSALAAEMVSLGRQVLGLLTVEPAEWARLANPLARPTGAAAITEGSDSLAGVGAQSEGLAEAAIEDLVAQRLEARKARNFKESDRIRDQLAAAGIVLEEFGPQLNSEGRRYLERICAGGQRMGELVDDLLAFSRLGRQPMNRKPIDSVQLVQSVLEESLPPANERLIEWRVGNLPACSGDPALLKQVWANLISNAVKYTRRSSPAVIEIGCDRSKAGDVFFVRDNGTGFDMQYAHKLFTVFQRLHRADEFEGTGVGLAIVQRIIHRHGGRVWTEAAVGRGATFYFTLEPEQST